MIQNMMGRKIGMTQFFLDNGEVAGVTAIEVGPCFVTQVKTEAKEGYNAVQIGFGEAKRLNKPQKGHLKENGQFKYLREFKVEDVSSVQLGQKVDIGMFKPGDLVDVVGLSKGRGFAGVVKKYHFAGGPKTHGQSDRHRARGSVGAGTFPGRVFKGTRMAGHMGNKRVTVRNIEVIEVDPARNLLLIKGAVPGYNGGGLLLINMARSKG